MVGDHKLKQLLAENGARISIALGRRSVTHVILGTPNNGGGTKGAGGGLAAGKIQKEIQRVGGKGVKFVSVEWYVPSLLSLSLYLSLFLLDHPYHCHPFQNTNSFRCYAKRPKKRKSEKKRKEKERKEKKGKKETFMKYLLNRFTGSCKA